MSKAEKVIQKMKANPRDWRIDNLETIAGYYGLDIRKSCGSHVVFGHKQSNFVVTVPAHKPIKPVYIRQLILLVESVIRG